ncbi:LacI family transcriptional regulator, partial [Rhizobium ruizarguesonis]
SRAFDAICSNALDLLAGDNSPADERIRISAPTLIPRKSTAPIR